MNKKYVKIGEIRVINSNPFKLENDIIEIPNHKVISPT